MKKLQSLVICLITLVVSAAPAPPTGSVNVTWSYDFASNPDVQGFLVYYGTSSSNYTTRISVNTTNYTVSGLPRNTWYFFNCTAFSTNGLEGDFTTEQSIRVSNKPKPVTALNVSQ